MGRVTVTAASPVSAGVAYVSLAPGSVPDGQHATIRNLASSVSVPTVVVNGGFDPVAINASVGDTLAVEITRTGSAAPLDGFEMVRALRPPVVVRTSPPKGGHDVPLNASVVIVFSEPLDSATANTGSVQLWRGTTPVVGTVRFADAAHLRAEFHPDSLLALQTDYQLVVTTAIRDLNGLVLDSTVAVPFTTGTTAPATGLIFASVSAGHMHTCGVTAAGAAYCWGSGGSGELGDGDTTSLQLSPVLVAGGVGFAVVDAGEYHTCGMTAAGAAYCWGDNLYGALGDGTTTDRSSPVPVAGGVRFAAVSAGGAHTCGVTAPGAAYCWGYNGEGELGDGTTNSSSTPVPVAGGLTFGAVSAGTYHSCGLTTTGAAYCWGHNTYGQVGDGTTTDRSSPALVAGGLNLAAVSVGEHHTCGFTAAGAAYCWGYNGNGQLGDGTTTNRSTPGLVAGDLSFAALSTTAYQTCGVTAASAAYCWGINGQGQLGDGTRDNPGRSTPGPVAGGLSFAVVSAGYFHTCGVTAAGATYCWGFNGAGELGDGTLTDSSVPVKVAGQP